MIDIDVEVDFDEKEALQAIADGAADEWAEGNTECPADDCGNDLFDVEMWVTDGNQIEGEAVCRECNARININVDDSEVKEGLRELEDSLEDMF